MLTELCAICLDCGPTCQLFCKHQYHAKCIGGWLKKSTCCPCCRMENIKGVKVYCIRCRWRYMILTRNVLSRHGSELPKKC